MRSTSPTAPSRTNTARRMLADRVFVQRNRRQPDAGVDVRILRGELVADRAYFGNHLLDRDPGLARPTPVRYQLAR